MRTILSCLTALMFVTLPLHAEGLADLLPETLVNAEGKEVSRDSLKGKVVGLYFSAGWCPPCRAFTPKLVEFRNKNKDDFEVVFVSSDKNAEAQMKYMKDYKMQWLAVPFVAEQRAALGTKFEVRGIPTLIIIDENGRTLSSDGRTDVMSNPDALKTWMEKAKKN
jgi:nucleoredoxin